MPGTGIPLEETPPSAPPPVTEGERKRSFALPSACGAEHNPDAWTPLLRWTSNDEEEIAA